MFALREIPAGFKICVDRAWTREEVNSSEPLLGILSSLEPRKGSLEEKFDLNAMGCDKNDDSTVPDRVVCMTMSRVNHSCNPNSEHAYVHGCKVKVLVALRAIQEGEEICFSYKSYDDPAFESTAEECRVGLKFKWNITCSKDCICYDKPRLKLVTKARKKDRQIQESASVGDSKAALDYVKQKDDILKQMNVSDFSAVTMRNCYDGFQIGVMDKATVCIAKEFLSRGSKFLLHFMAKITHRPKNGRSTTTIPLVIAIMR